MKQDLEAINAAIALGDRPGPPVGSMVRVNFYVQGTVLRIDAQGRWCRLAVGEYRHYFCYCDGYQVLELPSNAPPFTEWPR